jgi:hypothetical protein
MRYDKIQKGFQDVNHTTIKYAAFSNLENPLFISVFTLFLYFFVIYVVDKFICQTQLLTHQSQSKLHDLLVHHLGQ